MERFFFRGVVPAGVVSKDGGDNDAIPCHALGCHRIAKEHNGKKGSHRPLEDPKNLQKLLQGKTVHTLRACPSWIVDWQTRRWGEGQKKEHGRKRKIEARAIPWLRSFS